MKKTRLIKFILIKIKGMIPIRFKIWNKIQVKNQLRTSATFKKLETIYTKQAKSSIKVRVKATFLRYH